jgi:hypothetical protein
MFSPKNQTFQPLKRPFLMPKWVSNRLFAV